MVVGVDKARQQDLAAGAKNRDPRMLCDQLSSGADLGDTAVTLQHRAVVDLMPVPAVGGLGEDCAGADQAGGHIFSPDAELVSVALAMVSGAGCWRGRAAGDRPTGSCSIRQVLHRDATPRNS